MYILSTVFLVAELARSRNKRKYCPKLKKSEIKTLMQKYHLAVNSRKKQFNLQRCFKKDECHPNILSFELVLKKSHYFFCKITKFKGKKSIGSQTALFLQQIPNKDSSLFQDVLTEREATMFQDEVLECFPGTTSRKSGE